MAEEEPTFEPDDDRPLPPHRGIRAFQEHIEAIYGERDRARGLASTYMWFVEEVGELARALRRGEVENLREEFADCYAWLSSVASIAGIDMEDAAGRYKLGCPRCGETPCDCRRGPARS